MTTGSAWPLGEAQDAWAPVDPATTRRLRDLAAVDADPSADADRARFIQVLREAQAEFGRINPNEIRERLRGAVHPQRIGALYQSVKAAGLLIGPIAVATSTDASGGNAGKPVRIYRFEEPNT